VHEPPRARQSGTRPPVAQEEVRRDQAGGGSLVFLGSIEQMRHGLAEDPAPTSGTSRNTADAVPADFAEGLHRNDRDVAQATCISVVSQGSKEQPERHRPPIENISQAPVITR